MADKFLNHNLLNVLFLLSKSGVLVMRPEILEMVDDEIELAIRELSPDETLPPFVSRAVDMLQALQGRVVKNLEGEGFDSSRDEARRNLQAAMYGLVKAFIEETGCLSCDVELVQRVTVDGEKKTATMTWSCRKRK